MNAPPAPDDELAAAVLPRLEDLLGAGWERDAEDDAGDDAEGDARGRGGMPDVCLPDGFPDEALVAGDEIGFTLPDVAGLFALSSVFADPDAAARAWSMLNDEAFVDCFVSSVAEDVLPRDGTELVGPVTRGVDGSLGREASVGTRIAMFSNVDADAARPLALRCAVISAGRVLVLLWSVDRGDERADRRWNQVVTRTAERGATAGRAGRT